LRSRKTIAKAAVRSSVRANAPSRNATREDPTESPLPRLRRRSLKATRACRKMAGGPVDGRRYSPCWQIGSNRTPR
jgi:hypothetical protein